MRRLNFDEFKKFESRVKKIKAKKIEKFAGDTTAEIGNTLLEKVKEKTPTNYNVLRNSWNVGNVTRNDNVFTVEVDNQTEYAFFVEKGTRGVFVPDVGVTLHLDTHFTPGVFMLKRSEDEMRECTPKIVSSKLYDFLKVAFE